MDQYVLRDYQTKAVNKATWFFKNYENPFVIVMPTGAGKSLIISELCHQINEPVLILQPTKEILEQNYQKLKSYGIEDISIYSASLKTKEIDKFTYATIGSIYKKPELFKHFKYVLLDECDLLNPRNLKGMYNQFFKAIDCKHICGLTATPYRLVQRFYKKENEITGENETYYTAQLQMINRVFPFFFKKFVYKISVKELMDKGYLCPLNYRTYKDFDVSELKINTTGADYDEKSLEKFWNDKRLKKLAEIITEIDSSCKHNLIFCSSIRQATRCTELLRELGYSSDIVTSQDKPARREEVIGKFRAGEIKHLCNVNVLSVGFDFPALDSITLARPTISLRLLYQAIGRGMRPDPNRPDKMCQVIDITDNIKRLGRVETIEIKKEEGGFRDIVTTEVGEITGKPLFTFKIKDEKKKEGLNKMMKCNKTLAS